MGGKSRTFWKRWRGGNTTFSSSGGAVGGDAADVGGTETCETEGRQDKELSTDRKKKN